MFSRIAILLLSLCLVGPHQVQAQTWQTHSADKQQAVIELFVAEGCGLCPPAERWLEQLNTRDSNEKEVIPLAYHIDYLNDKKAWIDRFAKPEFSQRQRQLAKLNLYKTVFTPEFFISGEVLHVWRAHGLDAIHFINDFAPEADIAMEAEQQGQKLTVNIHVQVRGDENRNFAKLYLLLKQDDILSHIGGGDNAGATFNHQDLVRYLSVPYELSPNGDTTLTVQLDLEEGWELDKSELVAFVQNLHDGFILQGLALPLK